MHELVSEFEASQNIGKLMDLTFNGAEYCIVGNRETEFTFGPILSRKSGICPSCFVGRLFSNNFYPNLTHRIYLNQVRTNIAGYIDAIKNDPAFGFCRFSCCDGLSEPIAVVAPLPNCAFGCLTRFQDSRWEWTQTIDQISGLIHAVEVLPSHELGGTYVALGARTDAYIRTRAKNIGFSINEPTGLAKKISAFESLERYCLHFYDETRRDGEVVDLTSIDESLGLLVGRANGDSESLMALGGKILSGSAAGETYSEAISRASDELFEREIVNISWLAGGGLEGRSTLRWRKTGKMGSEFNYFVVGVFRGKAVVCCFQKQDSWPFLAYGFGVDRFIDIAAKRAKNELISTLTIMDVVERDQIPNVLLGFASDRQLAKTFNDWAIVDVEDSRDHYAKLSTKIWCFDVTTEDVKWSQVFGQFCSFSKVYRV